MVRSITEKGTLKITSVGGFMMHSIENEYCQIHTRSGKVYTGTILSAQPSVHVYTDARDFKREEKNMEVRIDELVENKDDVLEAGHLRRRFYFLRFPRGHYVQRVHQVPPSRRQGERGRPVRPAGIEPARGLDAAP